MLLRRHNGARDQGSQTAQSGQTVETEVRAASTRRGGNPFEKRRLKVECQAAVALTVLVSAGEATSSAAEQQGPWRQQVAPELISITEAAGQHDCHRRPGVALLEGAVCRP